MIKFLSISELAELNIRMNMGSYEDSWEEIAPELFYVSSLHVPDANCNLGYRRDGHSPSRQEVKTIEQVSADKSRTPAIWQIAGQPIPTGYKVSSREVWMVADTSTPLSDITVDQAQVHLSTPLPTKDGADVFEDVYCKGKGDIGYSSIPHEYADVYRSGVPNPPTRAFHVRVTIDNQCVAICNVNILGQTAGMYSVAVRLEYRRRGLGRLVATEGIKLGAKEGVKRIFLQTTADSPMQTMYESVGFKKAFVSELLVQKN